MYYNKSKNFRKCVLHNYPKNLSTIRFIPMIILFTYLILNKGDNK